MFLCMFVMIEWEQSALGGVRETELKCDEPPLSGCLLTQVAITLPHKGHGGLDFYAPLITKIYNNN